MKNSSTNFHIMGVRSQNTPEINFETIVNFCKGRFPYKFNDWENDKWDLTAYEKKASSSRVKHYRLIFALTSSRSGPRIEARTFSNPWGDLIKSFLVIRYLERGVGYGPQSTLLIAFRYLYQVIDKHSVHLKGLQNKHFKEAAKALQSREAPSTCYRVGNSLELISKLIDRFSLTMVKTGFASSFKRTDEYDPLSERTLDRHSKLQLSEIALEGIVRLNEVVKSSDERLIVEVLKLFLFTGLRITELLSLERNCLLLKVENGEEFVGIRYYPLKGGAEESRIKWFGEISGKLVKSTIYEIQKITLDAHEVARWIVRHPGKSYLRILFKNEEIQIDDFMKVLGTSSHSAAYSALIRKGIRPPYFVHKLDKDFRPSEESLIAFKDSKTGYELGLDKSLFVIFQDSYAIYKHKKKYMPMILNEGILMLAISGKEDNKYPIPSIFEKYKISGTDESGIHITSHMFRRLLNTIYNEGGVPLTILTKMFGRKNSKDTLSYLYTTPKKRTEDARELFKQGSMIGPKASLIQKTPIRKREDLINNMIESVHHLGFGFCCHDWSSLPCSKHLQCLDNCVDFHMDPQDPKTKRYLVEQLENAEDSFIKALTEVEEGTYGSSAQADHYRRVADTAEKYLKEIKKYEKS